MVFIEEHKNLYELRAYLLNRANTLENNGVIKQAVLAYMGFSHGVDTAFGAEATEVAVNGFLGKACKEQIDKIIGMAHELDGVPMPWKSDIWVMLGLKLAVLTINDKFISDRFIIWAKEGIKSQLEGKRYSKIERSIAHFIINELNPNDPSESSIAILFFYYKKLITDITDLSVKFWQEFRTLQDSIAPLELAMAVYVFDSMNEKAAIVPLQEWKNEDLYTYLKRIPHGLNCWTWEDTERKRGDEPVKWYIDNEYHVQNLLAVILMPIFSKLNKELNIGQVGHKNPRADLFVPELNTIIEVKYRKDAKKRFSQFTDELAADRSLYKAKGSGYENSKLVAFLWDSAATTEEYEKFRQGILKMDYDECIIIPAPSFMR